MSTLSAHPNLFWPPSSLPRCEVNLSSTCTTQYTQHHALMITFLLRLECLKPDPIAWTRMLSQIQMNSRSYPQPSSCVHVVGIICDYGTAAFGLRLSTRTWSEIYLVYSTPRPVWHLSRRPRKWPRRIQTHFRHSLLNGRGTETRRTGRPKRAETRIDCSGRNAGAAGGGDVTGDDDDGQQMCRRSLKGRGMSVRVTTRVFRDK